MMNKYIISKAAKNDLDEIWLYSYNKWSAEQADRYYKLLISEIEKISKDPYINKKINLNNKLYSILKVKSHLIFYRITEKKQIFIVRILHERMDITGRMT